MTKPFVAVVEEVAIAIVERQEERGDDRYVDTHSMEYLVLGVQGYRGVSKPCCWLSLRAAMNWGPDSLSVMRARSVFKYVPIAVVACLEDMPQYLILSYWMLGIL